MSVRLLMLGAGGHARVLLSALGPDAAVGGYLAPEIAFGRWPASIAYMGTDDCLETLDPTAWKLVNGLGTVRPGGPRPQLFEAAKAMGYGFERVVHPAAHLEADVATGEGVQIMAGAIIQCGVEIGSNVVVNTGAVVDHDCRLDDHVHLAPGVCLSGGVSVERGAHVGVGATVLQNIRIGAGALVGAGAVVVSDVGAGQVVIGVPAHPRAVERAGKG